MMRIACVVSLLLLSACKGSSNPTGPNGGGSAGGPTAPAVMRVADVEGPFNASFRGQPITGPGIYRFESLPEGSYDITGQMAGRVSFEIGTPSRGEGRYDVAVANSYAVLDGPGRVTGCHVEFHDSSPATMSTSKPFGFRFTVRPASSFSQQNLPCADPR